MIRLLSLYRRSFANLQPNIWILAITMFINRSGSMVLLFASLYLTNDLHFSIAEAGFAMSFYGIGSVLGSYAGGWLADRRHFFSIMLFALLSSGGILLLLLVVETPLLVSIIIFCYSFTADMFRPANSKAIVLFSTAENRTRSVSLVRLAVNLGFTLGPAAGGFVALYLGYRWLFVIDACTSFAAAAMLFRFLPRDAGAVAQKQAGVSGPRSLSAYRDWPYLVFILLVAFYGICFFQLFASIPQFFSRICHYREDTIGLLLALNGILVVVIEMPLVTLLEKKQKLFPFIIAGTLCLPAAFSILLFGNGAMAAAAVYTVMITMAEIFAMPFMMNYALSRPGKDRQGQYSALYSIAFGLSNIFAPLFGLGIADRFGFYKMFYCFIVLSIVTAAGFWMLSRRKADA